MDIWLPNSGVVSVGEINASRAVEDYDPELILGRNEQTGDWHVFVKDGPYDGQPFPVMYLGEELPSYDEIQRLLYTHDVKRHGAKIIDAIERRKRIERERLEKQHADESEEVAEHIEWGLRQMGAHPKPRIFVPSEKGAD
jgi:hypothetical protein